MRSALLVSAVVVALPLVAPRAQQPAQTPVFRAGVDYVRVDVVVTDKDDRPIADLKREDFTIEEHGRQQTIDDFQFVSVPVAHRVIDVAHVEPPADVVTNLPRSEKSRLFVLVIDDLHILEQDIVPVKRIMTEFFQTVSPDDEVAVVFAGHSNLGQNFTSDPARLMKTVDHVRDAFGFGLDALGRSIPGKNNDPRYIEATARSADLVLANVAKSLAGSGHSRRAIVYVSAGSIASTTPIPDQGFPPPPTDYDDLQQVYDTARRSDVPIYTIDPRGQAMAEDAVRGGIGAVGGFGNAAGESVRASIAANIVRQQDRLAENAINTGGRAFTNQSDLLKAVDEIVADNGSYYLVGYYPNPFAADGKFHELNVKVNRPGLRVRARQGYVASSTTIGDTVDAKAALETAMTAGVNVSGLALQAFAVPLVSTGKGTSTAVAIEVSYPARSDAARTVEDELSVSLIALDEDGKVKASSSKTLQFKATMTAGRPATFFIDDVIALPSQPLTLKVGVGSRALGKSGTVQLPVDVPKGSDKLQLSGAAIGVTGPPREPAMDAGAIASLIPFQPTTSRVFAATDTLRVFARSSWGSKVSSAAATLSVAGQGGSTTQRVTVNGTPDQHQRMAAAIDVSLPLKGLAADVYRLVLDIRLADGQTASRVVPIDIR